MKWVLVIIVVVAATALMGDLCLAKPEVVTVEGQCDKDDTCRPLEPIHHHYKEEHGHEKGEENCSTTLAPDSKDSLARQLPPAVGAEHYPRLPPSPGARRVKVIRPIGSSLPINVARQVGFTVKKARFTKAIGGDIRLTFTEMLSNLGNAYTRNGVFFAPHDAGYFFSFHATAEKGYSFAIELHFQRLRFRRQIVTAYGSNGTLDHGANSAFLELDRGDLISLILVNGSAIHEGPDAYTTFTGFLFNLRRRSEV